MASTITIGNIPFYRLKQCMFPQKNIISFIFVCIYKEK